MDKLGFTFYPKDWWTSESYFELTPIQRYYYLECLFIMYSNDGYMKTQKTQFENRTRTMVSDLDWEIITSKFILEKDLFTHISVNKRMRKAVANRENGKKGGRPPKDDEKPKKPKDETQKNPPLESERETEIEDKDKLNEIEENYLERDLSELEILPLNNQKQKRKKVAPKKENETIEATPEFLDLWNQYKEYRVAKKKTFKFAGLQWEQQSFDKFFNLANANIETAKQILSQSIANNWDGLFELKETFKPQSNGTTTTSTKQQFKFSTENAIKTITSQTE